MRLRNASTYALPAYERLGRTLGPKPQGNRRSSQPPFTKPLRSSSPAIYRTSREFEGRHRSCPRSLRKPSARIAARNCGARKPARWYEKAKRNQEAPTASSAVYRKPARSLHGVRHCRLIAAIDTVDPLSAILHSLFSAGRQSPQNVTTSLASPAVSKKCRCSLTCSTLRRH